MERTKKLSKNKTKAKNVNSSNRKKPSNSLNKKTLTKKQFIILGTVVASIVAVAVVLLVVFLNKKNNDAVYVDRIEVSQNGRISGYKAKDVFDDEGMKLKVIYTNGDEEIVNSGWRIQYVDSSVAGDILHNDYFYGDETKVKIIYKNKECYQTIEKVEKIDYKSNIQLINYSQIDDGKISNIDQSNIKIISNGENDIDINKLKFYYYSIYTDQEIVQTNIDDGASQVCGMPTKPGNYKIVAKVDGNKIYKDKLSNIAQFNIIDEGEVWICSQNEYFSFKEDSRIIKNNPNFIHFEIKTETDGNKKIAYNSNINGNGTAYLFEDCVILNNNGEFKNLDIDENKLKIKDDENYLKKWVKPGFLGTYSMMLVQQTVNEVYPGIILSEPKICSITIYYDEEKDDGIICFEFDMLHKSGGDILENEIICGVVDFSINNQGKTELTFSTYDSQNQKSPLFKVANVVYEEALTSFVVEIANNDIKINSGEYAKVS